MLFTSVPSCHRAGTSSPSSMPRHTPRSRHHPEGVATATARHWTPRHGGTTWRLVTRSYAGVSFSRSTTKTSVAFGPIEPWPWAP
jgi:hypothetical protein